MARIPGVPDRTEVGGYVNQQRALELLGLRDKSRGWLHDLVKHGKLDAAYFDERTIMYSRRSIERYLQQRQERARAD